MNEFKQKLLEEYNELNSNHARMDRFIHSRKVDNVETEEVNRLKWQLKVMDEYLEVLEERLDYYHIEWRD